MKKVSVIIPVYNAESTLPQCLDSVLGQSLQELEVICVDDGSVDGSLGVLNQYAAGDSRVIVLTQPNQYAGVARNHGMSVGQGEYLAFLDADDGYLPGGLEGLYRQAVQHKLDMIKGGYQCLDAVTGREYQTLYSRNSCIGVLQRKRVLTFSQLPARLLNVPDVPWNGLYRRAFVEGNGLQFNDLRCVNDRSFYIACLLKAQRLMVTKRAMSYYRVGQEGSLVGQKAGHFQCQLQSYSIVRSLCAGIESALAQLVMQQELNGVFTWYHRVRPTAADTQTLDGQLSTFLQQMDEADVGVEFLKEFSYAKEYFHLRYGTVAPAQPSAVVRMLRCWQEHGWAYTWDRIAK